jgi:hypothetical protein|tara:strand:- start:5834 stop:6229 length:396 start_codon:yes stop_codon:yes gene_type:complete
MPRKRQNVGLEHGGDYGTVQATADSMNPNMGGIPLAEGEVAPDLSGAAPPVVSNTPPSSPQVMNRPLPIEQAKAFTPNITPLDAQGRGWDVTPTTPITITPKQESAELLSTWAAATGDPTLSEAAAQLANG